ncbi:MAG: hypothetical protein WC365_07810 [Candidatus Babeliales bacterium]|jgi:FtsZ-binding cell division protein ZapB
MSNVSGNCERCLKLKIMGWCSGDRNACENKLLDTVEALQQEKLQRIKEVSEQWAKEIVRADELQQENEQLKAQNGAMREALETLIKSLESYGSHDNPISPWSLISQARQVITTSTTYHNPADVRLLEKTKQALVAVFRENPTQESMEYAESVLAEIDKAVEK